MLHFYIFWKHQKTETKQKKCFTMNNITAFKIFLKGILQKVFEKSTQKDRLNMRLIRKKLRLCPAELQIFPVNPWKLDEYVYFQTSIRSSRCNWREINFNSFHAYNLFHAYASWKH